MREIKFRGMSLNGWVYGYYVVLPDGIGGLVDCVWQLGADDAVPVNSEIIGQYTGLTDEDGTEIYEGDIVNFGDFDYDCREFTCQGEVIFEDGCYHVTNSISESKLYNHADEYIKVIGNIYENPELLDDKQ